MPGTERSLALNELPWTEVARHLESDPRLLIPVGGCDPYGPHLPIGAATLVAEALCADLSREFGVLLAPTFHYGTNVPAEAEFAGAATLRPKTLNRALNELVSSWCAQGFREFVCVTCSQHDPHVEAVATLRASHGRVRVVEALSVDLSQFVEGRQGAEHAGEALTSLLLHLRPDVVRMEAARDYTLDEEQARRYAVGRLRRLPVGCPGSVGEPTRATAEKGRRMYEHILQKIRHKVFISPPPVEGAGA